MREIGPMDEGQQAIEDAARRMGKWPDQPPTEHQIELSKAISLKRIADAQERIAMIVDGSAPGVARYGDIAWIMQLIADRMPSQ